MEIRLKLRKIGNSLLISTHSTRRINQSIILSIQKAIDKHTAHAVSQSKEEIWESTDYESIKRAQEISNKFAIER